jgi:prolyl-tRNA synthetase
MYETYNAIFKKIGLNFRAVQADNGAIGGEGSHEFHVLAESGEDELLYDEESDFAANVEIAKDHPNKKNLKTCRGIEVGHIFQLGTKYSNDMKATFIDETGKPRPMIMGCYGIGVSRIVAAAIEQKNDENGIIFPQSIAPFKVVITPIGYDKSSKVKEAVDALYLLLLADNYDVLLDDRGLRPGVMFSEAELLGIPHRITISEKTLTDDKYEYKNRSSSDTSLIGSNELINLLKPS